MNLKFAKQNPIRVSIESYLELLEHEGRLHLEMSCFICDEHIQDNVIITRAYLTAHKKCVYGKTFCSKKIIQLFNTKSTIFLDDDEVQRLWNILTEGF